RQMTREPKSWVIASVGMLALAVVPGMPTGLFILLSLITGTLGYYLVRQRQIQAEPAAEPTEVVRPEENGREELRGFDPSRP
ncbi:FHIPEP family type III secretion protein, partial [Pseudomonas sp. MD332_6]|uniref:FHIPEP family type III secretion protein n=1 Tax=Pseudomonas sp. MD332_6 TaxID=3241256 RepID=UPI0036D2A433